MNQIKFEVALDANNSRQMVAAAKFMFALAEVAEGLPADMPKVTDVAEAVIKQMPAEPATEKAPTRKTRTKADVEQAEKANSVEAEPKEAVAEEKPKEVEQTGTVTIEAVRAALAPKTESFRAEIKEKLTALGAKNVSTLDEKHYSEFLDFLQSL